MKIILGLIIGIIFFYLASTYLKNSVIPLEETNGFKSGYMETCTKGADYKYCSCSYDYLRQRYSLSEMSQMGIDYNNTGVIPQPMYDAVGYCIK